ncbi:hypothetical protein HMJ29_16905 [Hymenobacter taeanensis]|uniref:Uncharacterized protein n=1 Tax=Hymenobacter taeanensis TaxID=2735321 RepID=A0A6M6BM37_9BACT|nr:MULTISPECIES: hypothetical protein [Hymenobacter]QJX48503.1 hypothetical protein HMJ29_16905 [Hymenobacter taeanensis]UOQ82000.1 hypothetical protein MUN83_04215 [Hymenobacter sp. 5414T-23]
MLPFLKKLFSSGSAASATDWQPLQRSAAEERLRQQWVQEQVYLNWMGPYFKAYHYQKAGLPNATFRVQLLHEEGRQGALFFYDPSIGPGNFRHLFDFMRDRVVALGYNLSTSDQRSVHHASYTETIYKHFLKPQPRDCTQTGRCNQLYGNITIDLVSINGQPGFLRLFSNPFANDIFTPAHSFDEMLAAILDMPPAPPEVQKLIKKYARK